MKPLLNFCINVAKKPKPVIKSNKESTKVSRLCLATVVLEKGIFKAKINMLNDPDYPDFMLVDFTQKSLSLNDKATIYLRQRDELNHIVQIIRDDVHKGLWHPNPDIYCSVQENICVSGNIVRTKGVLEFELKGIHGFANNPLDLPVRLDETRPLFQ